MKRFALLSLALIVLTAFLPNPAHAQATRTWVSGVGDDVNPCSRTAPCKTFAGAISKTAAGGEINCLDSGGFGAVTITKSMTISCEGLTAGVLVAAGSGVIVNAGLADVVHLRGLDFEGLGVGSPSQVNTTAGINFIKGLALHVEHCSIRGFVNTGSPTLGIGINFAPTGGITSQLYVSDTTVANNGTGVNGGGIFVAPGTGTSANATLTRVRVENNAVGIKGLGDGTTGKIFMTIEDSESSGSPHSGIVASTTNGAVNIQVNRSASVNNNVGIQASGGAAAVVIGSSVVTGNATGATAPNSGVLLSYKNNQINGNTTDGTPIAPVGLN